MRVTTLTKKFLAFVVAAGLSAFQVAAAQAVCTPVGGGIGAVIAGSAGSTILSVDVTTGKYTQVANVSAVVPAAQGINSLANNPNNSLIYFTSNVQAATNKSIFFYNLVTGATGSVIADVTVAGTGITIGTGGMGSGSAFYDIGTNSLFIGVERPASGGTAFNTTLYRIPLDAAGTGTTGAAVVVTNDTTNWGDVVIAGGNLHSFGTNAAGTLQYKRYNASTGVADTAGTLTTGVNYQAAFDSVGNVKVLGSAASTIQTFDVAGSPAAGLTGTQLTITSNGTTALGANNINDAASCTPAIATIGDTVWADLNANGTQEAGEAGIGGVTVELYSDINGNGIVDGSDALLGTTTTDSAGLYSFAKVLPGQYTVKTVPAGSPIAGATQTNPSAVGANTKQATISTVGGIDLTADFGYRFNADLQITKTNNATSVNAAGTTSYDIVVTNAGPDTIPNSVITDPAVAGLSKTSVTCAGAQCPVAGNVTTAALESAAGITIPSLASGQSVTFTVAANVTATSGTVANAATITGPLGHFDPVPGNNSVSDSDPVTPSANLSISKTDGLSSIIAGGTSTYNIVVSNAGPSAADSAIFTDPAVTGLNVSSVTCGTPVPTGGAVCPTVANTTVSLMQGAGIVIPTLPSGGTVTFVVTATVADNAPSPLVNAAKVITPVGTSDPDDPTRTGAGNNGASDSNTVTPLAPFACDGTFFQTRASGTETSLLRFPAIGPGADPATSVWTANAGIGLNGLAFNPNDNFLYAFRINPNTNTRDLYKLGTTNPALAGTIVDASLTNTFVITGATFDSQGRLFFIGQGTGGIAPAAVYRVDSFADSDLATPGVQIAVAQIYPLSAATPNIGDFAFGPDGNLYGATGTNVYQFLLSGGTATVTSRAIPTVGGIGSAFFDQNNRFYVYENGTSKLYQVTFSFGAAFATDPVNSVTADTIAYSPPPALPATVGATDGASCTPKVVNVSGQVWQDPNNSITIDGTETGTNASSSTLTVYAVDSTGNVVSKAPVAANGTYTLVGVPSNTSVTLRLSNDATVTVGNLAPTVPSLPAGWVNTGENKNGTTETTTPGEIALTTGITNLPNQNFGIEQPPVPTSATNSSIPASAGPTTLVTGLAATDPDGTVAFFKVDSLPPASEGVLYYADGVTPVLTTDPPFNAAVAAGLKFDPSGTFTGNSSFTFSAIDNAGKTSLTPATYTIPITAAADLSISKTDGASSVNAGGNTSYTIVVTNAGPSAANGAIFTDPAVTGLTVSSVTCGSETGGAICSTPANTTVSLMQGAGIVIPTLPSGGTVTFTVNATVAANAPSPLVNAATILTPVGVSDPTDPTRTGAGNNTGSDSNTVQPVADVSVVKTGPGTVTQGGAISYTIVVSNAGPSAADNSIFTDPAVAGLTVSSVTCGTETGGAVCSTPANTTVALMQGAGIVIPTLPSGGSVTFTVGGTVTGAGSITNIATALPPVGTNDPNDPTRTGAGNNSSSFPTNSGPVADLAVTKTNNVATLDAGGTTSYTIVVTNNGPSAANNAVVTDPAVAGLSKTAVTCGTPLGGAVCPASSTVALLEGAGIVIPTLPSGGSLTFTVNANITATTGSVTNVVNVAPPAGVTDNNNLNDSANDNDPVNPRADLSVSKTNAVASVDAGGTTSYTIVVSNAGPSAADNAVITDAAVAGLSKTAVTCGTPTGGAVCATPGNTTVALLEGAGIVIPTLPAGGSVTLTVAANVTATSGTVNNIVSVTPPAGTTDPSAGNNTANDNDPVNPVADLSITKTDGATSVNAGGTSTYTIVVSNAGSSSADGAIFADPAVTGLNVSSVTCGAETGGAVCSTPANTTVALMQGAGIIVPTLPSGGTVTYTVNATVAANAPSPLVNAATILTPVGVNDPTDPTRTGAGNNTGSDSNTVQPVADLSITKTDGAGSVSAGGTSTYTIVVSNAGPSAADGAIFTDPAVTGLNVSSVTCGTETGGAVCSTPANTTVSLMQGAGIVIPILPSGGSVTYTVNATVAGNAPSPLINAATVITPVGVTDPTDPTRTGAGNNGATDSNTVQPVANLSITKTDGVSSINASGTSVYTIVVSNAGPSAANGAIFADPAVTGLNVSSVTCGTETGGALCSTPANTTVALMQGAGIVIPTLPSGGTVTYTVTASVAGNAPSPLVNAATVITPVGVGDPDDPTRTGAGNNGASDSNTVQPIANLTITKTDNVASVDAGGTTTYTIVVSNAGPSAANNAIFKDAAVSGLSVSSVTCGTETGGAVCSTPANTTVALMQGAGIIIPTLPSGGSVTYTVNAAVTAAGGSVANVATIDPPVGVTDPTPGDNTATDTNPVNPRADLGIVKSNSATSLVAGTATTYTLTVTNAGPSAANNALVTDPAVAGLTKTAVTCGSATGGAVCPASSTVVLLEGAGIVIPTLPAGGSMVFTINADVTATTGSIANVATIAPPAGVTDPTPGNDSSTKTLPVTKVADVRVQKTGPLNVLQGDPISYTVVVTNDGPSDANNTVVTDPAVAGLNITNVTCGTPTNGAICPAGVTVAALQGAGITIATLPSTGSLTFTVTGTVTGSGSITNTAKAIVPSDVTDPTDPTRTGAGNNTGASTTNGGPTADLQLVKTNSATSVDAGGTTTYTLTVTNNGPSAANNALVTDPAVAGLSKTGVTCGTPTGGAVCPASSTVALLEGAGIVIPTLPSGGSLVFTVNADVTATTGSVANVATIAPPTGVTDPTPGNNTGTDTDPVNPRADLQLVKTNGGSSLTAGGTTTYSLTITNNGPSAANNALVTDPAVAGLNVTSVTCGSAAGSAVCPAPANTTVALLQSTGIVVPTLPAGGSMVFTVNAGVTATTGSVTNSASINPPAGVTDPTPGNNTGTDTDTVNPQADLVVTKTDNQTTVDAGGATSYTIVVTNNGPSAADNAVFTDPAVTGLNVSSVTCGTPVNGAVCPTAGNTTVALMQGAGIVIPTLPNGGSVTFTVAGTVAGDAPSPLVNTATITPPPGVNDPTPGNNNGGDSSNVQPVADISVTKTDGATSVNAGGSITYTIVVTNAGPSAANNAVFSDPAVAGLTVTGVTCGTPTGGAACPATSTVAAMQGAGITIPTLPANSSVTFTVTGNVALGAASPLVNTAKAITPVGVNDPTDPTRTGAGNNSGSDSNTINPPGGVTVKVYVDRNRDSIDQGTDPGLAGVTVEVRNSSNVVVATGVTDAAGSVSFPTLPVGTYTVVETQPAGYGSSQNPSNSVSVTVATGATQTVKFGETASTLAGKVYRDDNNNGTQQAGEPGLAGVTATLTPAVGAPIVTTTAADGSYSFIDLPAGTYTVTETQPTAYLDGQAIAGSVAGTPGINTVTGIVLPATTDATGYDFTERGTTLSGTVFNDRNRDSTQNPGDAGIPSVTVTLTGTDANGSPVSLTTTTAPDGTYSFPNLPAGTYTVTETQPTGYGSSAASPNAVPVTITAGTTPAPVNFADTTSTLTGTVYNDANNNGAQNAGETGIQGVTVTLTGTDANGAPVTKTTTTDSSGNYSFIDLLSGTYTITETQPAAFNDGLDTNGTPAGTLGNDVISSIPVTAGIDGTGYLFGETGTPITGQVYKDVNRDGSNTGDPGIQGVTVNLKNSAGTIIATTQTDATGNYSFPPQPAGTYTIEEIQPAGYGNSENPSNSVLITVVAGQPVPATNFGETTSSLSGKVYRDDNNDGIRDGSEFGIGGVTVTLTGTDANGVAVNKTTTSASDGTYSFTDLLSGNYTIAETQPAAYSDGKDTNGTPAPTGAVTNDSFISVPLTPGQNGTGYLFGERGTAISGVVYNDANKDGIKQPGEPGLGNVLVTLLDGAGNPVDSDPNLPGIQPTTTLTDGDGQYSFPNLPAGTYTVKETQPAGTGSSENPTNSVPVTLVNGAPQTVNFGDTFSSINGQVYFDANGNNAKDPTEVGIGGVTVTLTGTDANGATVNQSATTDSNGNYSFKNLTTGTYTITETQPAGYTDGGETNGTPAGTVTNDTISSIPITIPATDATGYLFGETGTPVAGRVFVDTNNNGLQDPGEPGLPGVTMTLTAVGGGTAITTTTDANGDYNFPGVPAGSYTITESQPTGYGSSLNPTNVAPVTVTAGAPTPLTNFGDTPTNISGEVFRDDNNNGVQDGTEPGIAGVTVTVTGTDAKGAAVTKTVTTDATGAYAVTNLLSGTYTVKETQPTAYTDGKDTNGTPTGTAANDSFSSIVFADGQSGVGYNFGELGTSINGKVFVDADKDGIQDPTEPGKPGVIVTLKDAAGNVVATTTTGPDGSYSFPNLPAGNYTIEETQPTGFGSSTPNTIPVVLAAGAPGTANFGDTLSSFTGTVYNDVNNDGVKQAGEAGISNVTVTLTGTDANGAPVSKTTTTDSSGNYSFPGLLAGTYTITETQPSAYNDGKDTNGTPAGTLGNDVISSIVLPVGTDGAGYLFGETGTPITGTVYVDANADSTKQPTEAGIPLVTVELKNAAGTTVATTQTDANGNYSFPPQPAGTYTVVETQPAGYGNSENPTNSAPITVTAGQPVPPVNFGETTSSLAGVVFRDDNNDGIKQATEPGIAGVTVTVSGTDVSGVPVSKTLTTDANGVYTANDLKAGTYTIIETQPTAYNDGKDSNGTPAGTLANDTISSIPLGAGVKGTGYGFGETGNTINGQVFKDSNADNIKDPTETGLGGVTITLKDVGGNDIDSDPTTPGVQPTTTTTAPDGTFSFPNLPAGDYRVVETQPNGLGSSQGSPDSLPVKIVSGDPTTVRFADTPSSISGSTYVDTNNNGVKDAGEAGIAGVTVTLTGTDANGAGVTQTTTSDANGNWKLADLLSGTYTIKETQPTAYSDGKDTNGSIPGTASNDQFSNIVVPIGTNATGYLFGESGTAITGKVYLDANRNGADNSEPGIAGVTVELKDSTGATIATTTTAPDGSFSFPPQVAGTYTVVETQPAGYGNGLQNPTNSVPVTVVANQPVAPVLFGEVNSSLSGTVYKDDNNDGIKDGAEFGIPGVTVTITGTNPNGAITPIVVTTNAQGDWIVPNLLSGSYTVTETQPTAYGDGKENPGTPAGIITVNDVISSIPLTGGVQGVNYNFGERGTGISGVVYNDSNKDSTKQATEPGLGGVLVTLKDGNGADIDSDPTTPGVQPTTTITDGDGQYSFPNLPAGNYQVVETQPAGTGSSENPSNIVPVILATTPKTVNFGDTFSSISGQVYNDANGNGTKDATEPGLSNVTVTLTGTDANGNPVNRSALTDANGDYSFKDLTTGTYTITETQPNAYSDGAETNGTPAGTVTNDKFSNIPITVPATDATGYLFGEKGTPVAGTVFLDRNKDGIQQPDEPGIPGVTLTLTPVGGGTPVTIVTDPNGNYTFGNVPAGDYTITETQPVGLGSSTPNTIPVKVTAGGVVPAVNNFGDTPASLTGKVYRDDNNNGTQDAGEPGIAGATVTLTGTDASGTVNKTATTDATGNWIINDLKAGTYSVVETQPTAYTDGKDTNGTPAGTPANDSFSSIALTPGQAGTGYTFGELGTSINGKVFVDADKDGIQDPTEPGKPGVIVTLKDAAGNVVATTTTGPDGSYSFPNLPAGNYTIEETQPTGFGSSTPNTIPVVLAAGAPGTANFGDTLSSFTGTVYNDLNNDGVKQGTEAGISNVTVTLTGTDANGAPVSKTTTTDSSGNYSFPGLLAGTYTITETQPSAYNDGTDTNGTPAGTLGNDVISSIVLPIGTDGTGYLFGETGTPITGTVYKDNNLDGAKQPTEPGLPGVPVVLKNAAGTIVASTVTDANGNYSFPPQPAGTYTVVETQPAGYGNSENPTNSAPITIVAGQPVTPVNFGETPSSLAGTVFRDDNNDGIKQATEPGIPNTSILVTGTDVTGNNVSTTTTTDADGNWKVEGLKAGTYTISETQPSAYNDGKDANGTPAGTLGNDIISSIPLGLDPNTPAVQGKGYNFGETGNTINGQVFKDSNANGTLDPNETGIPGVLITLKDVNGNDIDSDQTTPGVQPTTTITDANGKYGFPNLPAGNYKVTETQPNGLGSSTPNTVPVDVRNGNPTTVLFGDTPSSIAGFVFNDANNNGIKDPTETGIAGVAVTLTGKDANNNPVSQTTTSDANGDWKFGDLVSGTYTVKETQPVSFIDGKETDGSIASTISNDQFANIVLPIGTNATNYRFAEQAPKTGTVTGVVFNDTNGDGIQNNGETGIPGIDVTLTPTGGTPIVVKTNPDGTYSIPNAPAGAGTINVTDPTGTKLTTNNDPQPVTVPAGSSVAATPVGYQPLGTINGKVFNDLNGDGKQDPNEPGIPGATVTVTTPDGKTITVITDKDGNYSVPNVPVGNNQVVVTKPDGTVLTTGNNPQTVPVTAGQAATATPVGFQGKGGLNGVVFEDKNGDKTQQPNEPGITGAVVTIKDAAGNDIDSDPATAGIQPTTTTTDANGKYSFPALPAGPVQVIVTPPAGYVTTTPERNPQTVTIPTGGTADALPVGLVKPSIAIAKNVVQGDTVIPAEQQRPEVMVGSTLRYQIKVTNDGVVTLSNIKVTDTLPLGLTYISGSSSLVNSSFKLDEPVVTDGTGADKGRKVLTYSLPATLKLEPGQSLSLRLSTVVTPSTPAGALLVNKAKASASAGSGVGTAEVNSDTAIAAVKVNLGVFKTPNVIVGRVYFDRNNDNNYTAGIDAPLSGARVYLSDGRFAVTDANGNYSIPEITPGVYAIRLDPITAPYPVKHVPDDQGAPGTRYVRTNDAGGIINEDFLLLEPSAAAVKARSTTVQRGPVTLNKSLIQGGAGYAVNEQITLEKAVSNLSITDPLPNGSAERGPITITNAAGQAVKFELSKDGKTITIPGTIPAGSYKITYAIFTALPPDQVLTDPDIDYEEILLGAFPGFETSRTSDEVTR